jgi:hypothetical protein
MYSANLQISRTANCMYGLGFDVGMKTVVTARAGVLLDRSPLLFGIDPMQGQDSHMAVPFSVSLQ